MELNTMSVHALSKRVEELEQQLAAAEAEANKSFVEKLGLADLLVAKDEALQDALHFLTQIDPVHWPSRQEARKIITTIRNALASPAAEPVPTASGDVLQAYRAKREELGEAAMPAHLVTPTCAYFHHGWNAAMQAQPAPATEPANPLPANWRALLQHELDVQAKHYGQMAACASAGSRFHAGERDCTEGVIKGIEYCIDILSEAESKPAPVAQSEQEKGQ